jgi:chromosome segregation ATPase
MDDIIEEESYLLDSFSFFDESSNSDQIQKLEQENKKQKIEIENLTGALNGSRNYILSLDTNVVNLINLLEEQKKIINDLKRKNKESNDQQKNLAIKNSQIKKKDYEIKSLLDQIISMQKQEAIMQDITQGAIDARDEKIKSLEETIYDLNYADYSRIKPKSTTN